MAVRKFCHDQDSKTILLSSLQCNRGSVGQSVRPEFLHELPPVVQRAAPSGPDDSALGHGRVGGVGNQPPRIRLRPAVSTVSSREVPSGSKDAPVQPSASVHAPIRAVLRASIDGGFRSLGRQGGLSGHFSCASRRPWCCTRLVTMKNAECFVPTPQDTVLNKSTQNGKWVPCPRPGAPGRGHGTQLVMLFFRQSLVRQKENTR